MKLFTALLFSLCALPCLAQTVCDSLATENARMWQEAIEQRTQIEALLDRVQRGNYDLEKSLKEARILRDLMKGYVHTIDSLHQETIRLREQLDQR